MTLKVSMKALPVPDELLNMSKKVDAQVAKQAASKLKGWAGKVSNKMQTYPSAPSGSSYVRTGRLGSNWNISNDGPYSVIVSNDVEYAPLVEGDRQTATHSSTGWPVLSEVAEEQWKKTLKEIKQLFEGL